MTSKHVSHCRIGLLMVTVLVTGLAGCARQQTATRESTRWQTPQASESWATHSDRLTVPAGTQVQMTLSTSLGSETSYVDDVIIATTTENVMIGGRVALPMGSTIYGRVTDVLVAKKGLDVSDKGGTVVVAFDRVTTPQGYTTAMSGSLTSVASSGGKTAGIIGGSAAGGAILGKILGGSSKDAALGAVLGGGIGTAIAAGTKGKELNIPAGTHLAIELDEALTITDRT